MADYREHIAEVSAALADPTRREIMDFVAGSDEPLSVREVARHFGLHDNAARAHLERLARGGLLSMVRSRGKRGGRPAHLYRASDAEWELSMPPRRYRLLAEIMVHAVSGEASDVKRRAEEEAFSRGREEALRTGSPLARLAPGCGHSALVQAWEEEMRRRGERVRFAHKESGVLEVTFTSCPFGGISGDEEGLVCEVHRRLEEGFLSTAGIYGLKRGESRCTFLLDPGVSR